MPVLISLCVVLGACGGCAETPPTKNGIAPVAAADDDVLAAFARFPTGGPARVRPLYDNVDAWVARWRVVEGARTSIDVVTFILSADPFGLSFLGLLRAKAEEGVRVRLLVDSAGTVTFSNPKLDPSWLHALDRLPNVEVHVYNPAKGALSQILEDASLVPALASNHDKIVIVDGEKAVVGGRNVADEYFAHPADDAEVFFDKDVLIEGRAVAAALRVAFERELRDDASMKLVDKARDDGPDRTAALDDARARMDDWLRAAPATARVARTAETTPERPRRDVQGDPQKQPYVPVADALVEHPRLRGAGLRAPPSAYDAEVRVLDSCSKAGCDQNAVNEGISRLVAAAKKRILIENPYLVLTDKGVDALAAAAARGVEIVVVTNSPVSSDNAFSQAVFLEQFPVLLQRVPTMRLFVMGESHNIHGKVAVFDDEVTLVGSYNLDVVSAKVNSEVVAAVRSRAFAARSAEALLARVAAGPPRVYEYRVKTSTDGEPVVVFGPEDHCDPARWKKLVLLRKALQVRSGLPGLTPLL